jgi:hypothetical protein
MYTDGAPNTTENYKSFVTLAKIKNLAMIISHCSIHPKALVTKMYEKKCFKKF